jgi:uncharacterized protein (TIGR00375 family)
MFFFADFHIHSHYSLATSRELIPEFLDYWARIKGITVIGTGDFTHPKWTKELQEKLVPAEEGLFRLKDSLIKKELLSAQQLAHKVRFLLTAEVSSIYKQAGKVRKIHNLIFAPDFETTARIQKTLEERGGNIRSDGRPILGISARDLLEITLNANDKAFFVPAHIWTPWFSVLGSKSGFNTIDECFLDLKDHIYAVETGLSSDPEMNWHCSFLDAYTLISNSDAHSPEKLGREANRFNTSLEYSAIIDALKTGDPEKFLGTVEFFPAEGKYHYDGHRDCGISFHPDETRVHAGLCPRCQKPLTIGVMNRVKELADRTDPQQRKNRHPFSSIIPLKEIIAQITGTRPSAKKVAAEYTELIQLFGSEFEILLQTPIEKIKKSGREKLADGISRMRTGEVTLKHGYDGEFGTISVF